MNNTITNRVFYKFSEKELEILCKHSNYSMLRYQKAIALKKQYIDGLFYEISQTTGNWSFKNRVLPGLFDELFNQLTDTIAIINEYEKDDLFDNYLIQSKYYRNKIRRFNLFRYLTDLFEQKFIKYDEKYLSRAYTHNWLSKEIRKMDIRINNILKEYRKYTIDQCEDYAMEGLKILIIEKLGREKLPLLSTPKDLADMFNYNIANSKKLRKKIKKCFKPDVGNTEYHLGLIPIWEDIPGRGLSAYYFDYNKDKMVLIVDRAKAPLLADDRIPYIQTGPTILEIFEQIGQKEKFVEWFNSEKVKEKLAWHLLFRIVYRYEENKKELTEEDYERSTELAKDILKLLEEYYGITYPFEEITDLIKQKEIECIKGHNLKDEVKEKQIEIINKLFPVIKS